MVELRALRAQFVDELHAFIDFFDIGGVDHKHGGFLCGLAHDGRRLSSLKFIWFNGRGVTTYARAHVMGYLDDLPPPPGNHGGHATMRDYLLDVALRGLKFALERGQDKCTGGWVVEMSEDGRAIKSEKTGPANGNAPSCKCTLRYSIVSTWSLFEV